MSIREILRGALWLHGYDGLANARAECGCRLDDLMPCGCPDVDECVPGRAAVDAEGIAVVVVGEEVEE